MNYICSVLGIWRSPVHRECIIPYLSRLNDGGGNSENWHENDWGGIVVVVVGEPEGDWEDLEDVEGIEDLEEEELHGTLDLDSDLIVPVN